MKNFSAQIIVLVVLLFSANCIVSAQAKDITVGQKNKTFILEGKKVETLTIAKGDTLHFMNNDPWFHNIYSLSQAKTFDLGSYPQGESRPVIFDVPGKYEIECAIHPNMFLEVTVK